MEDARKHKIGQKSPHNLVALKIESAVAFMLSTSQQSPTTCTTSGSADMLDLLFEGQRHFTATYVFVEVLNRTKWW